MKTETKGSLVVYQFQNLHRYSAITHFFTTRKGGQSLPPYNSLNLSYNTQDDQKTVKHNRQIIASALHISPANLIVPGQVHGNTVRIIDGLQDYSKLQSTDGLINNRRHLAIGVLVADCVPLLLYDTVQNVIAAIHAGWRGTFSQIAAQAVCKMKDHFQSSPENIMAGIGPSIGPDNYEIGKTVAEQFSEKHSWASTIIKKKNGRYYCDLWKANKIQLMQEGIKEHHIEISGICTYDSNEFLYSHRRSGGQTGRMAALIKLE
jgi:hypothetical protein